MGLALVIDASAPASKTSTTSTTTTASFTPPANSLIVACVVVGNNTHTGTKTGTVTDSISSSWTLKKRQNSANLASAEIWMADAGASPSARTVTLTGTASGVQLSVLVFTSALAVAGQSGATGASNGTAYTASVTTTTDGSYVVGALGRSTSAVTLSANAFTTALLSTSDATNAETYGTFRSTTLTSTPGTVTLGYTNTGSATQEIAAVEVLPLPAVDFATSSESGSVTVLSVPAPDYEETFDEGVDGATLSTSYGGIATYDTEVSGSKTYTSASVRGLAAEFFVSSPSAVHYAQTPASGTGARYIRFYFKVSNGFGGANVDLFKAIGPAGVGFGFDGNGKAQFGNNSFTTLVANGNWWRVELDIDNTTTNAQVRIYSNPSSVVPTETQTFFSSVPATAYASFRFGVPNTNGGATPDVSIDDIAVSSSAPPSIWMPTGVTGSDTGSSSESAGLGISVSAADTGSWSDTAQAQRSVSDSDTATAVESSTVQAQLSSVDSATGTDTALGDMAVAAGDTGTAVDSASIGIPIGSSDSGTFTDAGNRAADSFHDDFSAQDLTTWNAYGPNVRLSSGQLVIDCTLSYYSLSTVQYVSLVSSSMSIQLVQHPDFGTGSTEAIMAWKINPGTSQDYLAFLVSNNSVVFRCVAAGSYSDTSLTWDAVNHAYWRIRESAGTIYWDTSADGLTWTNRRSLANPYPGGSSGQIYLQSGYWNTEGTLSPSTAIFDNFNFAVLTAADTGSSSETAQVQQFHSVSDTVTGTESASLASFLAASDTGTGEENWYSIADFFESDSGSAVEAVSRGIGTDIADGVGLGDSISFAVGYGIVVADSAGPTDATVPASSYRRATTDTAGLADTFSTTADLQRPLPDNVGIRDQGIAHRFDYGRAPTDGVNLVETIVFALTEHTQDGVGLADSAARTWGLGTAASDPVGLADSTTTAWAGVRRWSDTVALADSVSFDIAVVVVDVVSIQERVSPPVGLTRTIADTIRLVDDLTYGYGVAADDTVGLEDDADDSSALRIINEEDTATALDDFAVSRLYFDFQRISLLVDEDIPLMRTGNYR